MGQISFAVRISRVTALKRDISCVMWKGLFSLVENQCVVTFLRDWWGSWQVEPRALVGLPPECSRSCGAVRPQGYGKGRIGGG